MTGRTGRAEQVGRVEADRYSKLGAVAASFAENIAQIAAG
jgi:hypothetical protein